MISAIDDLGTDLLFIFFKTVDKDEWDITLDNLNERPQKKIALFVPAWQESEVITEMVNHNLANIDYQNYDFFVGVYPNDKGTVKKVNRLERKYPRVYKSEVPHDGPTCKADCLNWLYQRMKLAEENEKKSYDIIIMHDAEDIIHPLSFKLVNYLMPEYQMVQVPVFSLEVQWNHFTAGTYCDEFAEHHIKNLSVREKMKGFIPSAGVGTAFARTALDFLAEKSDGLVFNTDSLTEDYEIGLKFSQNNFKQIIARRAIRVKRNAKWLNYLPGFLRNLFQYKFQFIATREYFPNKAKAAIKQKSRWILGIIFQGWEQIRWKASWRNRVFLYIDRKGIYSNLASFLANILFFFGLFYIAAYYIFDLRYGLQRFFPTSGFIWYLIIFNTFVMFERISIKFYSTATLYGAKSGFVSILRIPWLNVINFFAMCRAIYRYFYHKITRTRMTWDKTTHVFPSRDAMKVYRKRLGELLLENRIISQADLEEALTMQQKEGIRLGEILIRMNLVTEDALTELLSNQHEMKTVEHFTFDHRLMEKVHADILGLFELIPISLEENILLLGVREPLEEETQENIEMATGYEVQQKIIPNKEFYEARKKVHVPVRLGMHLVLKGHLKGDDILDALSEQRDSGEPLGDILVKNRMIDAETLSKEFMEISGMEFLFKPETYKEIEQVDTETAKESGKINDKINVKINDKVNDKVNDKINDKVNDKESDKLSDTTAGYVLQDEKGTLTFASKRLPAPTIKKEIIKKYPGIVFKLLLLKDMNKWKKAA